uniref:Uncharacterized protein n=1 Tax=viral metagenome TaxID=1070528 RepID=A0A6C0CGJ6_9ZZZZ
MDSQFNTLIQSYHDNYIQFAVNGDTKYQTAYQQAEDSIKKLIQEKQDELNSAESNIQSMLGDQTQQQIRNNFSILNEIGIDIHNQQDRLTAANMRSNIQLPTGPTTNTYIWIASLLGVIVVLQLL